MQFSQKPYAFAGIPVGPRTSTGDTSSVGSQSCSDRAPPSLFLIQRRIFFARPGKSTCALSEVAEDALPAGLVEARAPCASTVPLSRGAICLEVHCRKIRSMLAPHEGQLDQSPHSNDALCRTDVFRNLLRHLRPEAARGFRLEVDEAGGHRAWHAHGQARRSSAPIRGPWAMRSRKRGPFRVAIHLLGGLRPPGRRRAPGRDAARSAPGLRAMRDQPPCRCARPVQRTSPIDPVR